MKRRGLPITIRKTYELPKEPGGKEAERFAEFVAYCKRIGNPTPSYAAWRRVNYSLPDNHVAPESRPPRRKKDGTQS